MKHVLLALFMALAGAAPLPEATPKPTPYFRLQICLPAMSPACAWQDYAGEIPLVVGDVGPLGRAYIFRAAHPEHGEVLMLVESDALVCKWTYDFGRMFICNF